MAATEGVRLMKEVDHPHVRLLYDVYREQTQSGDALAALEAAAPYVKAIHVADWPGRGDPGAAPVEKFDAIYKAIRKVGFEGPVAMAYRPAGDAAASLIRAVDAMRKSMAAAP